MYIDGTDKGKTVTAKVEKRVGRVPATSDNTDRRLLENAGQRPPPLSLRPAGSGQPRRGRAGPAGGSSSPRPSTAPR